MFGFGIHLIARRLTKSEMLLDIVKLVKLSFVKCWHMHARMVRASITAYLAR